MLAGDRWGGQNVTEPLRPAPSSTVAPPLGLNGRFHPTGGIQECGCFGRRDHRCRDTGGTTRGDQRDGR